MGITDEQQQQLQQLVDQEKDQMDDGELTSRVHLSLRRKYDFPEWALFEEVPGKTGKRADAIAFNMFPSRNFKTLGLEVKASRGDWKKELQDISKADYFVGQCDEWYVVAGRKGIVKESELPVGWGLLEMKGGGKLYTIVESDLTDHQNRPPDREFYARGIQKAMKRARQRKREKNRARREGYRKGKKEGKQEPEDMTREQKKLIENGLKYQEIQDMGLFLSPRKDRVERLKRAQDLLKTIKQEDRFLSLAGNMQNIEDKAQDMQQELTELREEVREFDRNRGDNAE